MGPVSCRHLNHDVVQKCRPWSPWWVVRVPSPSMQEVLTPRVALSSTIVSRPHQPRFSPLGWMPMDVQLDPVGRFVQALEPYSLLLKPKESPLPPPLPLKEATMLSPQLPPTLTIITTTSSLALLVLPV